MPAHTRVAILWHMHQPEYRVEGVPLLPWAYLHALRAYTDMAAHVEAVPDARVTMNFSPVLLDQLLDLAQQARAALTEDRPPTEPLMAALRAPDAPPRAALLAACVRAHERNAQHRFADYARLRSEAAAALAVGDAAVAALPAQFVTDLVVWYHLVWLGESVRDADPRAQRLVARRGGFDALDCRGLLELVAELLEGLVPRFRALAASGQVELAMSPYYHPILPLLADFRSAHESAPGVPLPHGQYPGGLERARWHLAEARARFADVFGAPPRGCWPSEAAISQDTVALLEEAGFDWFAASQSVHAASLRYHGALDEHACRYRLHGRRIACFFRDDGLSDRIGFVYKDWQPRDAVADLVGHLDALAGKRHGRPLVLALDGENPWEYYADNGIDFVRGLYAALAHHPRLRMATFAECVDDDRADVPELPGVVAGSWVHGQLLTWIGNPQKNRAWELLVDAKRRFDAAAAPAADALRALGICEASDWFWWPGSHHSAAAVSDFDTLYRTHLATLWRALGEAPPAVLAQPFASAVDVSDSRALGAMLPSQ